jgi:DNA-binding response OmpR family regulator/predicted transcriptional regulator
MSCRPFNILLVASDRAILRHASRLLNVFGYNIRTATSYAQAAHLIEGDKPDILLLDGADRQQALELCREAGALPRGNYVYKLLFAEDMQPGDVVQFLEAGVDDFLASPVEHGELLARLRAAARVLEFERRVACQGAHNKLALVDLETFLLRMEAEIETAGAAKKPFACLAIALDHPRTMQILEGRRPLEATIDYLLKVIGEHASDVLAIAQPADATFVLLLQSTATAAVAFADRLRGEFASSNAQADNKRWQPTLSCGVAEIEASMSPQDLLRQAETSLALAQSSGGDCAVYCGQFAAEDQHWADLANNGALFEHTLARDIMVPCALVLGSNTPLSQAATLFGQTELQALPVVDEEGKLAGLVTASSVRLLLEAEPAGGEPVSSFMTSDMASFDERTTLAALIDYFTQESPLAIVIVHKSRPTGLVTPSTLATLSEQLTTDSFAESALRPGHAGFIVPNLCGADR